MNDGPRDAIAAIDGVIEAPALVLRLLDFAAAHRAPAGQIPDRPRSP